MWWAQHSVQQSTGSRQRLPVAQKLTDAQPSMARDLPTGKTFLSCTWATLQCGHFVVLGVFFNSQALVIIWDGLRVSLKAVALRDFTL